MGKLDEVGLESEDHFRQLWLRERFFYMMHKRTGQDYGFCEHFVPAFRNRTRSILEDDLNLDLMSKCCYGTRIPEDTLCSGTDRDRCVFLNRGREDVMRIRITNISNLVQRMRHPEYN